MVSTWVAAGARARGRGRGLGRVEDIAVNSQNAIVGIT